MVQFVGEGFHFRRQVRIVFGPCIDWGTLLAQSERASGFELGGQNSCMGDSTPVLVQPSFYCTDRFDCRSGMGRSYLVSSHINVPFSSIEASTDYFFINHTSATCQPRP